MGGDYRFKFKSEKGIVKKIEKAFKEKGYLVEDKSDEYPSIIVDNAEGTFCFHAVEHGQETTIGIDRSFFYAIGISSPYRGEYPPYTIDKGVYKMFSILSTILDKETEFEIEDDYAIGEILHCKLKDIDKLPEVLWPYKNEKQ